MSFQKGWNKPWTKEYLRWVLKNEKLQILQRKKALQEECKNMGKSEEAKNNEEIRISEQCNRIGRIEDKWILLAGNYFDKVSEAMSVRAPNANNNKMAKMPPSLENLK